MTEPNAAPPVPPPSEETRPPCLRLLFANAINALRMALFLRVPDERFPASWWQIVFFAGLTLLIPLLFDMGNSSFEGALNGDALPGAALHITLAFVATVLCAYLLNRAERVQRLLLACLMIAAVVDAATYGSLIPIHVLNLPIGSGVYQAYQYAPTAWWILAFLVYATRGANVRRLQALAAGVLFGVCLAPLVSLDRNRSLWVATPEKPLESGPPRIYAAGEEVLNAQPQLLAKALDAIESGTAGTPEFFFVGMAGYGPQDVFRKEVDEVEKIFRARFGTRGRTIKLVNNFATPLTEPFANLTNLRASLKRVAERMNADEDVLVLFLTSHGSESHEFSLDLWPLRFDKLDPKTLRKVLDESGIRQRVVIVSACYSGGFVNALRDKDTLVISASAPDRNSFGCSNEAEWTYFGKAYFDEALRNSYSFTEAFERSLPVIAQREKKDDYKPSNPQMALGEDIAPRLATMSRALREAAHALRDSPQSPSSR